jgi:hypothetical protein
MSEEEIKQQRMDLLVELDAQKTMVTNLTERQKRERDAFRAFTDAYAIPGRYAQVHGDRLRISTIDYPLSAFDVIAATERRKELDAAETRLRELMERSKALGISLS